MNEWRTYGRWGSVVITAGAVITGSLWYDRRSMQIRAEDYAELMAAKWERGIAFKTEGDWPYDWNAGTVTPRIVKSKVEAAVDGLASYVAPDAIFAPGTWLDTTYPLPGDGGTAVTYTAAWYMMTTNKPGPGNWWRRTGNDSANCKALRTLNTRAVEYGPFIVVPNHTNTLVPVAFIGRSLMQNAGAGLAAGQNSFFWGGLGSWWTYAGLGTNVFVMPHDIIYPIRTNVLSDARTLARAMTRTAVFYSPTSISGWTGATNFLCVTEYSEDTQSTQRTDNIESPTATEWQAVVTASAESLIIVETNAAVNTTIAEAFCQTVTYERWQDPAGTPDDFWRVDCEAWARRRKAYNIISPYPSPQAIASGMVSRVRIYLIAVHDLVGWPLSGGSLFLQGGWIQTYPAPDVDLEDWTLDTTKPQTYLDDALGTGLKICPPPVVTNTIAYIGPDEETYANYCRDTDARPDKIIVNLVYDSGEEGPVTERPVFDLAANFSLTDLSTKQHMMEKIVHGVLGVPQYRWYERRNRRLYWNRIKVYGAMIVVDWNFAHLTDTPYVPTPYTPEWLSTNTP